MIKLAYLLIASLFWYDKIHFHHLFSSNNENDNTFLLFFEFYY